MKICSLLTRKKEKIESKGSPQCCIHDDESEEASILATVTTSDHNTDLRKPATQNNSYCSNLTSFQSWIPIVWNQHALKTISIQFWAVQNRPL